MIQRLLVLLCVVVIAPTILLPGVLYADWEDGLVPEECQSPVTWDACTICHVQQMAVNILEFFFVLACIVAALLFVNAGILYIFSSANPANISKAHRLFMNTLIGLIIILAAWLIIGVVMELSDYSTTWMEFLCT